MSYEIAVKELLLQVAEGKMNWKDFIRNFEVYLKAVERIEDMMDKSWGWLRIFEAELVKEGIRIND